MSLCPVLIANWIHREEQHTSNLLTVRIITVQAILNECTFRNMRNISITSVELMDRANFYN